MKKTILILGIFIGLALGITKAIILLFQDNTSKIPGMILIPKGKFIMGNNSGRIDARPAHEIYLDDYYIDKYEVSNKDYKKFIDATGYSAPNVDTNKYPWAKQYNWHNNTYPKGTENLPVVLVNWNDANAYAKWCGKRLPTEAEWEKAAKGPNNLLFPWGNEWDSTKCNVSSSGIKTTLPVNSNKNGISGYGVFNMIGNVWEWCSDYYDKDYYKVSPKISPKGPEVGATRIIRGGSWNTFGNNNFRCDSRESQFPSVKSLDIGFRCVKDIEKK